MRFWSTFSKMKTVYASASVLGLIDHNFLPLVCLLWSGLLGRVRRAPNEEKKKKKDKKKNKEPKDPSATKKPKSDKKGKKKDKLTTTTLPPTTTTTTLPPTTTRESSWELACRSTWTALTHECCWPCVCLSASSHPDWASHWTLHRLSLSWRWWVTHTRPSQKLGYFIRIPTSITKV